jgi:hypothetical protein
MAFGALLDFYGRDWPLSIVPPDGNSQTVKLIQPNAINRAGLSVGEHDGFSEELRLHVSERGEDRRRVELRSCHGVPKSPPGERVSAVVLRQTSARANDAIGPRAMALEIRGNGAPIRTAVIWKINHVVDPDQVVAGPWPLVSGSG